MTEPGYRRVGIELSVALVAVLFVLPVVLVYVTSLKPDAEIIKLESILPQDPAKGIQENFKYVLTTPEEIPIFPSWRERRLGWLGNSMLVSSCVTLLVLTVDSLAAYALARLNLPGRKYVFALIIGTLMVPGQILLVPVYLILNHLGWIDSLLALIFPAGAGAFGVFLLHQFLKAIPREVEESAMLDGASRLQIWWHIMVPLSRPALATLAIFSFIGSWNDFLAPRVFLDSVERYTLPVGIELFQSSYAAEYGLTLAASVICTTPILFIFLLFSRHIIRGMAMSGLKD